MADDFDREMEMLARVLWAAVSLGALTLGIVLAKFDFIVLGSLSVCAGLFAACVLVWHLTGAWRLE